MKQFLFIGLYFLATNIYSQSISSPSKNIVLNFSLTDNGKPTYSISYKNKPIILQSYLGIKLKEATDLATNFNIEYSYDRVIDETWQPVLGEQSNIRNYCNELVIALLQKSTNRKMNIIFRVFDEGASFRYEFPKQDNLKHFIIADEVSEFNLTGNHKVFWIPGDLDSNEYAYNETKFSEIDVDKIDKNNGIGMKGPMTQYRVQSPLMMKTVDNLYLNIFEAAVVNYPVMHLNADVTKFSLQSYLVPNAIGDKAYLQTPCVSPWRTIIVSDDARDIVSSKMILNLNEPSKLTDTSWIKPMKYVGVWWEMHVNKSTWDYGGSQNYKLGDALQPTGKHGATTENAKHYIDFAAKHGFDGVLVEGWNIGWEDWFGKGKENVFDYTTPYPDFDLKTVNDYAKSKGIKMIMHQETASSVSNFEKHLDTVFEFMKQYDYTTVKTGYVGHIIPRGEMHDGQMMVNHYNYVAQRAADYKIMVNSHESSRPTGYSRTYPNYICAEAARGNEFNAWSIGNPPMHETILPFTRLFG